VEPAQAKDMAVRLEAKYLLMAALVVGLVILLLVVLVPLPWQVAPVVVVAAVERLPVMGAMAVLYPAL
jgi:hypothetical protein